MPGDSQVPEQHGGNLPYQCLYGFDQRGQAAPGSFQYCECSLAQDVLCPFLAGSDATVTTTYHPYALKLSAQGRAGTLPTELGLLTHAVALDLSSNQFSGTVPTQIGNLVRLRGLWIQGNRISGFLPSQLGALMSLTALVASNNHISGFIPSELGLMTHLGDSSSSPISHKLGGSGIEDPFDHSLWLSSNPISGTIPSELALLNQSLSRCFLQDMKLSGTIPESLLTALAAATTSTFSSDENTDPFLTTFAVSKNKLSLPFPAIVSEHCLTPGIYCYGLPPDSCSAYGADNSRLSFMTRGACVQCPPLIVTIMWLVGLTLVFVGFLYLLYRLYRWAEKSKKKALKLISTLSIAICHIQILFLLGSLVSSQDSGLSALTGSFSVIFGDPSLLRLECFFPDTGHSVFRYGDVAADSASVDDGARMDSQLMATLIQMVVPASALFALFVLTVVCKEKRADKFARYTVIVFTVQLVTVVKRATGAMGDTLSGRISNSLIPSVAFALLCVELLYIAILAWQSRTLIRTDEANKSPCAGGYSMTHDRLSYRLGPLVAKYSKDTPYWQIVVSSLPPYRCRV